MEYYVCQSHLLHTDSSTAGFDPNSEKPVNRKRTNTASSGGGNEKRTANKASAIGVFHENLGVASIPRKISPENSRKGKNAEQARKKLCEIYGEDCLTECQRQHWFTRLLSGNFNVQDTPHTGHPTTTDDNKIKRLVETNRRMTTREIAEKFDIPNSTVYLHLQQLGYVNKLDVWVPHEGPPSTLFYADGVALIADSRAELQLKVQKWQTVLADAGFKLNLRKTEVMSSIGGGDAVLDENGTAFTQTEEFQYLGSILSADGTVDAAVRGRIVCAWLKWRESTEILCDRMCSRVLKGKIYHVVRPAMMYGSECWPVSKTHERMLNTAEMRMLRWECGLTRRDKVRNEDIRALMQTAPMQQKLRAQRLRWFGHVMRRPPLHPTRQAMEMEVTGKRPTGAPKRRWKDT
ncbi:hypothetical protein ANCCEY_14900, partial [Ancylostoma ceylanicum]